MKALLIAGKPVSGNKKAEKARRKALRRTTSSHYQTTHSTRQKDFIEKGAITVYYLPNQGSAAFLIQ